MLALSVLGGVAGQRRHRILDLAGFEVAATALVALVAAGLLAAVRAGALDVAVGQRLVFFRVPGHLDRLLVYVPLVFEAADDIAGEFGVCLVVRVAVVVKGDVELRERLPVLLVPLEGELFGIDALLPGVDGNRGAVHVRAADIDRVLADVVQRAVQRVGGGVAPQVADVQVPVGVGKPCGHDCRVLCRIRFVAHGSVSVCVG